jgi:hypothetical protein
MCWAGLRAPSQAKPSPVKPSPCSELGVGLGWALYPETAIKVDSKKLLFLEMSHDQHVCLHKKGFLEWVSWCVCNLSEDVKNGRDSYDYICPVPATTTKSASSSLCRMSLTLLLLPSISASAGLGLACKGSGFIECQAQAQPKPGQHYMLLRQLISAVYIWITWVFIVASRMIVVNNR